MKPVRHGRAHLLYLFRSRLTQAVLLVRVGKLGTVKMLQAVDRGARFQAGGSIVEVNNRLAMNARLQHGKIIADLLSIQDRFCLLNFCDYLHSTWKLLDTKEL